MPEEDTSQEVKLIVGLDFGTAYSGYAISHKLKPEEAEGFYNWPGQPEPYAKTLTALYYEEQADGTFEATAWGFPARKKATMRKKSNSLVIRRSMCVERFKLLLDETEQPMSERRRRLLRMMRGTGTPRCMEGGDIKLPPGRSLESVIGDYLRFLKQDVERVLMKQYDGILTLSNVQWCLSVPAMWTDRAKARMRQAAYLAGMIPDIDSPRLAFTLEPEAAAVYCKHNRSQYHFNEDQTFMVVDAGGGTVDLTVHKVMPGGGMEEVTRGHGESCGATYVDKELVKWVKEKLGEEYFLEWTTKFPGEMAQLMAHWEASKRRYAGPEGESIDISMTPKMARKLPAEIEERLEEQQNGYGDSFIFTAPEMARVFDPVVDKVLALIEEQMRRLREEGAEGERELDAMLLVGGFSSSPYLVRRVRETFGERVQCIVNPPQPGSAVVIGAVHYGSNPSVIKARVSRFTYGVDSSSRFNPKNPSHAEHEADKVYDEKRQEHRLRRLFKPFVRMGQLVPVGHKVAQTYTPLYDDQTEVGFQIYHSASDAFFVTEDGVRKLGERIVVEVPESGDRGVKAVLHFGDTEIRLEVIPNDLSYRSKVTTVKFHCK
ncbi:heat shock protein 70 family protein [Kipferlia bialata]|uniref:Heat shock protein 70 family protein n=1 Tax=Kipferlia bialata TaxID=797122 RepID=A0A9K3GLH5_9EUKA|nr:heat shock protein 70 family protein [Kipferlia bialata]|eukprot:g9380.t1